MTAIDRGGVRAAALDYASRGWPVLPCHSVGPNGCSCGQLDCSSPGKHPCTARGLHAASTNRAQIMAWWRRWPSANVAVRTGTESGLVVIDIDPPHGGTTMRARIGDHGPLPRGPVVRTGSGGWHLLFAHPGERVPNSTGTLLGPGVDVRGDGGYVIAPPSRHANGSTYRWDVVADDLPRLPDWMLNLLRTPQRSRPSDVRDPVRIDAATSAWARVALDREADRVRSAPNGSRNSTLNRAAFSLGQIVGSGVLDASTVERVLAESATASGLGTREAFFKFNHPFRSPRRPRQSARTADPKPRPVVRPDAGDDERRGPRRHRSALRAGDPAQAEETRGAAEIICNCAAAQWRRRRVMLGIRSAVGHAATAAPRGSQARRRTAGSSSHLRSSRRNGRAARRDGPGFLES